MLDRDQVVRAALGHQVPGVGALSVQRVRRDHRSGQVNAIQKGREHRDLVRLGLDVGLAQDHAVLVIEGGQQVPARTAGPAATDEPTMGASM